MYRASTLVFGHFHPTLGMMSLVELEACATGTAVISYDKYEIMTPLEDLENITFSILEDPCAYKDFVEKNRVIVLGNHRAENVAKQLLLDIAMSQEDIFIKPLSKIAILENIRDIENIEKKTLQLA
jgi:hypothetical protein